MGADEERAEVERLREENKSLKEQIMNLKEQLSSFKEQVKDWQHDTEKRILGLVGQVNGLQKNMDELLENSRWMKRVWTKAIISMVVGVAGSIILSLGGVIWWMATK